VNLLQQDLNQGEGFLRPGGQGDAFIRQRTRHFRLDHPAVTLLLFCTTFFTTTVAGVQWLNQNPFDLSNFALGLPYSVSLLFVLASHEFGHYFASMYHGVKATLPFFIPFPVTEGFLNFGTLGAVIRTKSPVPSRRAMFDIGVTGPIAGFVASLLVLSVGFLTVPDISYLYHIHPEYRSMPALPPDGLTFGGTILYNSLEYLFRPFVHGFIPPMNEIYHYPFLCVGWFGLFVTAMNLLPVGQLDGGHIIYGMFGGRHRVVARIALGLIIAMGLLGFLPLIGLKAYGWTGWLFWALILLFIVKIDHPPIDDPVDLGPGRMAVGWAAIVILILSFSVAPFSLPV